MLSRAHVTRLVSAVLVSALSCFFVQLYTQASVWLFTHEHPGHGYLGGVELLVNYHLWGYLVPAMSLIVGLLILRWRPGSVVAFECVIGTLWLLTAFLVFATLMYWRLQQYSVLTG